MWEHVAGVLPDHTHSEIAKVRAPADAMLEVHVKDLPRLSIDLTSSWYVESRQSEEQWEYV